MKNEQEAFQLVPGTSSNEKRPRVASMVPADDDARFLKRVECQAG